MDKKEIINLFLENKNKDEAKKMSAYMKDNFVFLGIKKPIRAELSKSFLKTIKKEDENIDWSFVNELWNLQREFQYLAIEYLKIFKKKLTADDIPYLKKLILANSWWDTIDALDKLVGSVAMKDESIKRLMIDWSNEDNIWLRRVAIDHQLGQKEKTDLPLLEVIIINNLDDNEFFINKSIGWSLRDVSKVNPDWVKRFINKHEKHMATLSIKEASKYLV